MSQTMSQSSATDPSYAEQIDQILADLREEFKVWTKEQETLSGDMVRVPVKVEVLMAKCREAIRTLHPFCGGDVAELPKLIIEKVIAGGASDSPMDGVALDVLTWEMKEEAQALQDWQPAPSRRSGSELIDLAVEKYYGTLENLATESKVDRKDLDRIRSGKRVTSLTHRKNIAKAITKGGIPCTPGDLLNPSEGRRQGRPPKSKPNAQR